MDTLRERVIGILSGTVDNLTFWEGNHANDDDVAVKVIASAKPHVIELIERYSADAPNPIYPRAAQELLALAKTLRTIGEASGNATAHRDLEHEAALLDQFVMLCTLHVVEGEYYFTT